MKSKGSSRRPRGEAIERELRSLRDQAQLASGVRPQARQGSSTHVPPPDEKKQYQQRQQQRTAFAKQGGETGREFTSLTHSQQAVLFFCSNSRCYCMWGKGIRRLLRARGLLVLQNDSQPARVYVLHWPHEAETPDRTGWRGGSSCTPQNTAVCRIP